MMQLMFELTDGVHLRDQGMAKTLEHAEFNQPGWVESTMESLQKFCENLKAMGVREFVMEQFRDAQGDYQPPNPNAWGAISRIAAQREMIRWTGRSQNAKRISAHARSVKIWEII